MDDQEFSELIDRHGADAGRWPADRRTAATILLLRSEVARALQAETAALERLLRTDAVRAGTAVPDPSAGAMAARAMRGPQVASIRPAVRRAAFGIAAALVLAAGLAIGIRTSRGGVAGDGLDEAPSQILRVALGMSGGGRDGGEGAADVE